jgi:hypothetical protein
MAVGLSSSATTAPASWTNAIVNAGSWSASLTPAAIGTIYVWAQQTSATSVQAISSAVHVVAAGLSVTAPGTGTAGAALAVTGSVSPTTDAVNVQLATQDSTAPTGGWTAAVNTAGSFAASLTAVAAGTYYAWAQDPATGLTAVSAAIVVTAAPGLTLTINNPGGSYAHGTGSIGLNGGISPTQVVSVQVVLSTSNTTAPTAGWQAATQFNFDEEWAIYYPTPATAGSYYVWVETASGGSLTVSSFTISVT